MELRELFLRPKPADSTAFPNEKTVSQVYRRVKHDAWTVDGRYWGAYSFAKNINQIDFTVRPGSGGIPELHPDATFSLPSTRWTLSPGQAHAFMGGSWLCVTAGTGDFKDFEHKLKGVEK